jgi:hypothetical protein
MQGPIDTVNYMLAGYIVIFGTMLIYLASLVIRYRNLRQEEEILSNIEEPEVLQEQV